MSFQAQFLERSFVINNYWMRFFVISGIIKVEVSVLQPKPKDEADNTYRDLDYSRYHKNRI